MNGRIATPVAVNSTPAVPRTKFRHRARVRPRSANALLRSATTRLSTVPWENLARQALADLRMPGTWDTEVRLRRLVGVSAWALLLGLVGLVLGARVLFGIFTAMPLWYVTLLFALGIPGVIATVGAFLTLHKGQLTWKLMGIASAAEVLTVAATLLS
ncbi:hypothetical protein HC031_28865 [Planosporangium thailandense]|uniref:Uncharacterized protein n=1 Tax=Planosporangium thailandense TaxID=765197 RepID=A0ABX0Y6E6_9ACTN|nr:hypothetical protein [Planosporangium thailandense]NJC73702.1 hypothetical protein [Planosporangium thailandense]